MCAHVCLRRERTLPLNACGDMRVRVQHDMILALCGSVPHVDVLFYWLVWVSALCVRGGLCPFD